MYSFADSLLPLFFLRLSKDLLARLLRHSPCHAMPRLAVLVGLAKKIINIDILCINTERQRLKQSRLERESERERERARAKERIEREREREREKEDTHFSFIYNSACVDLLSFVPMHVQTSPN